MALISATRLAGRGLSTSLFNAFSHVLFPLSAPIGHATLLSEPFFGYVTIDQRIPNISMSFFESYFSFSCVELHVNATRHTS
jgi:hypothetical protein